MKIRIFIILLTLVIPSISFATDAGIAADNVVGVLTSISGLLMAIAYICAIGFGLSGIVKIKQHKDNPQQMPLSTPITELAIALALAFFPSILAISGNTIFGSSSQFATPSGIPTAPGNNSSGLPSIGAQPPTMQPIGNQQSTFQQNAIPQQQMVAPQQPPQTYLPEDYYQPLPDDDFYDPLPLPPNPPPGT